MYDGRKGKAMKIIYLPGFTKKRHPLLELLAAAALLLGFPYGVYRLVAALLREYTNYSAAMIHVNAKIYAGVIGCACAALLLVVGFYSMAFQTVAERWGNCSKTSEAAFLRRDCMLICVICGRAALTSGCIWP